VEFAASVTTTPTHCNPQPQRTVTPTPPHCNPPPPPPQEGAPPGPAFRLDYSCDKNALVMGEYEIRNIPASVLDSGRVQALIRKSNAALVKALSEAVGLQGAEGVAGVSREACQVTLIQAPARPAPEPPTSRLLISLSPYRLISLSPYHTLHKVPSSKNRTPSQKSAPPPSPGAPRAQGLRIRPGVACDMGQSGALPG